MAGSLFGHKKVYFVLGVNKIMPTLEEAIYRARNVAAPKNVLRHGKRPAHVQFLMDDRNTHLLRLFGA